MKKLKSIILFTCLAVTLAMGVNIAASFLNTTDTVYAASTKKQSTNGTAKRKNLVDFAKKFKKTRYVWGGTNLKKGVDCSGFVQAIYKKQGYKLPRTAHEQATKGKKVSTKGLQKGDLLFYGSKGKIKHVAIYIGDGKIIHASNRKDGVKISPYDYSKPVAMRRIIL